MDSGISLINDEKCAVLFVDALSKRKAESVATKHGTKIPLRSSYGLNLLVVATKGAVRLLHLLLV